MLFFNLVLKMDVYITVTFSCKLSIDIKDNVDAKFPMHKVTFQFTTFFFHFNTVLLKADIQ